MTRNIEGLKQLLKDAQSKSRRQPARTTKPRRPKKREISPETRSRILATYRREQSAYQTYKKTGISEQAVWRVLYETGYTEADLGRTITEQTQQKVLDRHREGMGVRCIAGRYRLREETVHRILEGLGG